MNDDGDVLSRARDAAATGDWKQAYALLTAADSSGRLAGTHLPWFAEVAYAAGHLDVAVETWEQVHATAVRTGDEIQAAGAAVRVAMHLLFDAALMAPVRGWLSRAERLMQGREPVGVLAWLAVVRSYERLLSGDVEAALPWARRAVEVGAAGEPAAAAIGRVAEARCLILRGQVGDGLEALDEAGVAILAGEIDPLSTGVVYCEVVCGLQALAQYDLAEQWTRAMERWAHRGAVGSLHGRCRVHRAEILRLRGAYAEAEEAAAGACEELRPYLRRELGWPLTELGRIRFRRGDLDGAEEAFRAAHDCGWDAQPGPALLALARGQVQAAAAAIRAALQHPSSVPSKELPPNTDLRRAPLLEAAVEIELAANERDRARRAAEQLSAIAARFESKALVAAAALARGRVRLADGQVADACAAFEDAVRLWSEIEAPHETAIARLGLAEAHRAAGRVSAAEAECQSAQATLARLGLKTGEPSEPGAEARQPQASTQQMFRCEGDTWLLVFEGRRARVRDLKGLHHLARLLAEPGRDFHAIDLAGAGTEGPEPVRGDAGPHLDARAKTAYRRRLTDIDEDIAEATSLGDLGRVAQAEAEREFLVRELSRAVGLGGRDRRAGSPAERARVRVTRAIRQAMARIRERHVPLADHLERFVRTGTYCAYLPDPRVSARWTV